MDELIFLSTPYSHTDKNVKRRRYEQAAQALALLMSKEIHCVSIIVMGCAALEHSDVPMPDNYQYWGEYCEKIVRVCSEVWVIDMDGWQESIGVQGEIAEAKRQGKKVHLIEFPVKYEPIKFIDEL